MERFKRFSRKGFRHPQWKVCSLGFENPAKSDFAFIVPCMKGKFLDAYEIVSLLEPG